MSRARLLAICDTFLEATSVAGKWRRLRPFERQLTAAVAKIFRKQGRAATQALAIRRYKFSESRRLREALTLSDGEEIAEAASAALREEFFETVQETAAQVLEIGATAAMGDVGIRVAFDLRHPRAVAYLEQHGYGLISQIDAVTRGNIATIISNGAYEGWSYNRMAREIISLYSFMADGRPQQHIDSRAHLIAVTEVGNAYEAGQDIVIREMQEAGEQMEKNWLTVGDNRVSAGCAANQAQGWIPYPQTFQSGHQHPLRFPGCRCTTLYRRKGA